MSAPLNTTSPLTYPSWLKYQGNLNPDKAQIFYANYLKEWYKSNTVTGNADSLKENYIQLLKDLSFLFGTEERDLFLTELDYANDEELIISIPYFVKKLKEICKVLSYKRESLKHSKLRYNLVGSNQGLEKLLYEYILKGFTVDENYISQVPISTLSRFFPALSSVNGNFFIELEELHDSQSYHDSDPSVPINQYVDIDQVKEDSIFDGLSEEEILGIISTRYLSRIADTPLSRLFNQYLSEIPSLSTASLLNSTTQTVYNEILANKKYLGESVYGLTAVRVSELNTPDLILNIDLEEGNNWFYWPSGDKIIDETQFNNVYSPININNSNFVNSGATGGLDYTNSDLIFSDKAGIVEGAWLRGPRIEKSEGTMQLTVKAESKKEFIFPYAGFKITSKGTRWGGFSLTDGDLLVYEKLLPEQKKKILENYYTETLPNSSSLPVYINNSALVYSNAYAAKFSDEADTLLKRNFNSTLNKVFSESLSGLSEEAYLYKFDKTDIPVSIGINDIAWPIDRTGLDSNFPITILNDTCLPVKLSETDALRTMAGAIAGNSIENSDIIYKLNTRTGDPIEAAWLGAGPLQALKIESGIPVYDDVAINCASYLEGTIQGGLFTKIDPKRKISFVWMDEDTPADQVIFYRKHSEDCPYSKTSPHNYYKNQDYLNPNPLEDFAPFTKCRCKSVLYSPIGHAGNSITDYNGMADYLFADPQGMGEDFAFNTWVDTRGYNPFESPQFSFYQLDGLEGDDEVGWGTGKWKTGNDSPMILKTGRRYTYYRTSLRSDFIIIPSTQQSVETPYLVLSYPYKNIKGIYNGDPNNVEDICILIDKSKSQQNDLEKTLKIVKEFCKGVIDSGSNTQISIVAFDSNSMEVSYLTNDKIALEFNLSNISISDVYPNYRTNIYDALNFAQYILRATISDNEQPDTLYELCNSLNATILKAGTFSILKNIPRENSKKTIIIFSDGYENINVGEAVPYANDLKNGTYPYIVALSIDITPPPAPKYNIYAVDIGPNSVFTDKMELMASENSYFNLQKYLTDGDGNENNFTQYLISLFSGNKLSVTPTWYKAVRGSNGSWIGTSEISDMILNAGDYISFIHRAESSYDGPNNTSFSTPSISFTINIKLNGWDYVTNTFSESHFGSIYGAKPYWGLSYTNPETNIDQHFDKENISFGGQLRFVDGYLPVHQPEVSPMILTNGSFMTYSRRGNKNLIWNQPLTFNVSFSDYRWNKIIFYKDTSNLSDLFRSGNNLDSIGYSSQEPSDILLESYSSFLPSVYNYYARNSFTYNQNLFKRARCPNTFAIFNTGVAIEASEPFANLDNMNYPTIATVSFPSLATTEKETGGYLLPENLGVSYWRGRGYTIDVSGDTLSFIDSISAERLFLNPDKFGPRKRGLTKKDQYSPTKIEDIDNRWMMLSYSSSEAAGRITDVLNNQKFTPYQSKYEITKRNNLGLCRQDDDFEFWDPNTNQWDNPEKYPLSFRKELLASSYENRKKELLINKGKLSEWKNDIFGNNYGLFKNYNFSLSSFCAYEDGLYYSLSSFGSFYFTISSENENLVYRNIKGLDFINFSSPVILRFPEPKTLFSPSTSTPPQPPEPTFYDVCPVGNCNWRIREIGYGINYESGSDPNTVPNSWSPPFYSYEGFMELQYSNDGGSSWETWESWTTLEGEPTVNLP